MPRHRKPGRKAKPASLQYVVEIDDWEFYYSFGLNKFGFSSESFQERTSITIRGPLREPPLAGIEAAEVHVSQWEHRIEPRAGSYTLDQTPLGSASLTRQGAVIRGLVSIPRHAIGPLCQVLAAGKIRYVALMAPALRYREAVAASVYFSTAYPE